MEESPEQILAEAGDPLNELEENLFKMWRGQISKEDFLRTFLISSLYIVVDGEPVGDTLGSRRPMVVSTAPDQPKMMAVFSAIERSDKMVKQFPDYNFPIQVDCRWVLNTIGPTMGVAFNPGWVMGFELNPDGAQQLKFALEQAIAQAGQ